MYRLFRQFVALLLTIWLPLFSGNALAVSIVMVKGSCCPASAAQPAETSSHHAAAKHRHMPHDQHASHQTQAAETCDQHAQQGSACDNCGTCHLAGSGYLAAPVMDVTQIQPSAQSFSADSTRFQSVIPTLLDPPPLARV